MHASTRRASALLLTVLFAGCGATPPSPAASPSAAAVALSPSAAPPSASATPAPSPVATATATPTASPTASPTAPLDMAPQAQAALAVLRDPKLAVEFRVSGSMTTGSVPLTVSGDVILAGRDLDVRLVTEELNVDSSEVAKGGKVWLRSGTERWLLDEQPLPPPAFAKAFPSTVTAGASSDVYLGSARLARVALTGANLDVLLAAMGMADADSTGASGVAYVLLAADGTLAGLELDATFTPSRGQAAETIVRTLSVVHLAHVGDAGAPKVATPSGAWVRHVSTAYAFLIAYPPTMKVSSGTAGESFKGPSPRYLMIAPSMARSGDTAASVAKAEVKRLQKGGITVVSNRAAKVDGEVARRLEVRFTSGGRSYWGVKYITIHGDVIYSLSWIDLASRRTALQKIVDEMLASFRTAF